MDANSGLPKHEGDEESARIERARLWWATCPTCRGVFGPAEIKCLNCEGELLLCLSRSEGRINESYYVTFYQFLRCERECGYSTMSTDCPKDGTTIELNYLAGWV